MARHSRRTRRGRRGISRIPRRKRGFTAVKGLQAILMLGPAAAKAIEDTGKAGGFTSKSGISKGLIPSISTSYTGFNPNDRKFYPNELLVGWGPVAIVAVASRLGLFRRISRAIG